MKFKDMTVEQIFNNIKTAAAVYEAECNKTFPGSEDLPPLETSPGGLLYRARVIGQFVDRLEEIAEELENG